MAILVSKEEKEDPESVTIAEEVYGEVGDHNKTKVTYTHNLQKNELSMFEGESRQLIPSAQHLLKTVFLPQGYPGSVSDDYLQYQVWDTAQAFCSSITGMLATQAMLKGYGVGDKNATAIAATVTWMLKDGSGMLGRILFAWAKGSQLDCDAKRWRFAADILNDIAIFLELISAYVHSWFLFVACFSSILKSIVGVAGGATRAALTQHQAKRDNMADVSAKDGSQETLVNLVALVVGLALVPLISDNSRIVWLLFITFTFFHLYCNYKAVTSVVMETVNLPRYQILVEHFVRTGEILNPKQVNPRDPVLHCPGFHVQPRLGVRFKVGIKSVADLEDALLYSVGKKYLLRFEPSRESGSIAIILHRDASQKDLFVSCFQFMIVDLLFRGSVANQVSIDNHSDIRTLMSDWHTAKQKAGEMMGPRAMYVAYKITADVFDEFFMGLQSAGWHLNRAHFAADEWRSVWRLPAHLEKKSN